MSVSEAEHGQLRMQVKSPLSMTWYISFHHRRWPVGVGAVAVWGGLAGVSRQVLVRRLGGGAWACWTPCLHTSQVMILSSVQASISSFQPTKAKFNWPDFPGSCPALSPRKGLFPRHVNQYYRSIGRYKGLKARLHIPGGRTSVSTSRSRECPDSKIDPSTSLEA